MGNKRLESEGRFFSCILITSKLGFTGKFWDARAHIILFDVLNIDHVGAGDTNHPPLNCIRNPLLDHLPFKPHADLFFIWLDIFSPGYNKPPWGRDD